MTIAEWISLVCGGGSILFTLILKAVDLGGFRGRVVEGERRHSDLERRVTKCETDTTTVGAAVAELKTQVAVQGAEVRGRIDALKDVSERDARDMRHDIASIKMGMEKLTDALISKRQA